MEIRIIKIILFNKMSFDFIFKKLNDCESNFGNTFTRRYTNFYEFYVVHKIKY